MQLPMVCNYGHYLTTVALFGVFSLPKPTLGARPQCTPGHFLNHTSDECDPCPENTFAERYNREDRCAECSRCTDMRKVEAACNATSDTKCSCPAGYYGHVDGCTLSRPKPSPTDTRDDAALRRVEAKLDNVSDSLQSLTFDMSYFRQLCASTLVYDSRVFNIAIAIVVITGFILIILIIFIIITPKAVKFCQLQASQHSSNRGGNAGEESSVYEVHTTRCSSDGQRTTRIDNERNEQAVRSSETVRLLTPQREQPSASFISRDATTNADNILLCGQSAAHALEPSENVVAAALQPQCEQPPASQENLRITSEARHSTPSDEASRPVSERSEEMAESLQPQPPASSVNAGGKTEASIPASSDGAARPVFETSKVAEHLHAQSAPESVRPVVSEATAVATHSTLI